MKRKAFRIEDEGNRLALIGDLDLNSYRRLLAALHNLVTRKGQRSYVLDFRQCGAAYPGAMAAICAAVGKHRRLGADAELLLPINIRLRNLFMNAGWAHLLDPERFDESKFKGYSHVPAVQFTSPREQKAAIDLTISTVLSSIDGLERSDLEAIEWSLNEIADNVLIHSGSSIGGIIHLNNYRAKKRVEFVVADAGVGIPATLREGPHAQLSPGADSRDTRHNAAARRGGDVIHASKTNESSCDKAQD